MSGEFRVNENVACETCGKFGAYQFDGHTLCDECYEKRGSCCPEFGADDLWRPEKLDAPARLRCERGE